MGKATFYLDDAVHKALKLKAAETRQSISELVNDALRAALTEELDDIADWTKRKEEQTLTHEELRAHLEADNTI